MPSRAAHLVFGPPVLRRGVAVVLMAVATCLAQESVLPPLDLDPGDISQQVAIVVEEFRFTGNTVFSDAELREVLASYVGRPLSSEDLEAARRALTVHYVDHGYITSGAVLPDQTVERGVITFDLVEGVLAEVEVSGHQYIRRGFYRDRALLGAGPPLQIRRLKDQLEVLRQHALVDRVNAELRPGLRPGRSVLELEVAERTPWQLGLRFDNHRSPSVGAERFHVLARHGSLTGHGDRLDLDYGLTRNGLDEIEPAGLDDLSLSYVLPITPQDTTVSFAYDRSSTLVVEPPFDDLDIDSESEDFAIGLRHPVLRTPETEVAVGISLENRINRTFLLGRPFSFAPGAQDGRSEVMVVRLSQELVHRTRAYALAGRSTFSFGLDALGASDGPGPDGAFFSWLGQVQFVQRLGETNNHVVLRLTSQLADTPMLALEQFAIGGARTVRGYRENQIVRDNGVVATVELRIPLLFDAATSRPIVSFAPFVDIGVGWDDRNGSEATELSSAGLGILLTPDPRVSLELYWGYPFRDFDTTEDDLQDAGVHFDVVLLLF